MHATSRSRMATCESFRADHSDTHGRLARGRLKLRSLRNSAASCNGCQLLCLSPQKPQPLLQDAAAFSRKIMDLLLHRGDVNEVCSHEVRALQFLVLLIDHHLHKIVVKLRTSEVQHVARAAARAPVRPVVPVAATPAAIVWALVRPMTHAAADPATTLFDPSGSIRLPWQATGCSNRWGVPLGHLASCRTLLVGLPLMQEETAHSQIRPPLWQKRIAWQEGSGLQMMHAGEPAKQLCMPAHSLCGTASALRSPASVVCSPASALPTAAFAKCSPA